ncbi:MAG: hypothetical protein HKO59_17115 [Phycisphaerales bacterium]|nr:hypothetical protein [Phycisphaerae bacterium]NNF43050.1 hypothetical protein [Phycisphaerales bacterium]NNM27671.1 hypothetical protein [Phycisphaerales bacterium]
MDAAAPIATIAPVPSMPVRTERVEIRPPAPPVGAALRAAEHFRRERDEAILLLAACERNACDPAASDPATPATPSVTRPLRRPYAAEPVGSITPRRTVMPAPPPVIPVRAVLQTTNVGTLLDVLA